MIYFLVLALSVVFGSELTSTSNWWDDCKGTNLRNDKHLERKIDRMSKPIIIDWYLEYCGWCEKFKPDWNRLYKRLRRKVKFVKADGKKLPEFKTKYGITGFPKIMMIMPDGEDYTFTGKRDYKTVKRWIIKLLKRNKCY